jgi:hypothetical protein
VTAPFVELEYRHVCHGTSDEQGKEYRCDGDVDVFFRSATERPYLWEVWRTLQLRLSAISTLNWSTNGLMIALHEVNQSKVQKCLPDSPFLQYEVECWRQQWFLVRWKR